MSSIPIIGLIYLFFVALSIYLRRKTFAFEYDKNGRYRSSFDYIFISLFSFVPIFGWIFTISDYIWELNKYKERHPGVSSPSGLERFVQILMVPKISPKKESKEKMVF